MTRRVMTTRFVRNSFASLSGWLTCLPQLARPKAAVPASTWLTKPLHNYSTIRSSFSSVNRFCSSVTSETLQGERKIELIKERSAGKEIEIHPLPDGIDGSRIGLYEILGTEGTGPEKDGCRAIFGVHGSREHWPAGGGAIDAAGGGIFAGVEAAGKQYKVTAGDTLYCHRIEGDVNTQIVLDRVVVLGTMLWTIFGRPYIPNAIVTCTVEAQTLTRNVIVAKFKKRKGYQRRKGHRQPITRLHIDRIDYQLPKSDELVPHKAEYDPLLPPLPNRYRHI